MYEVGAASTFHALHQLEAEGASAAHEHSHDYRVEVVVRGDRLAENGMLLDLDLLRGALAACLAELDAADLDGLPIFSGGSTTVEAVAEHVWTHVAGLVTATVSLRALRVTVYEATDAWASVDRSLGD